jgi:anti-sigma-K factor RskA
LKTEERHKELELCIPYVFGRLNPGNRKQFEAHLATGCPMCIKEVAELHEAMALMPLLLKQQEPPRQIRERLMSRLSAGKGPRAEDRRPAEKQLSGAAPQRGSKRPLLAYGIAGVAILIILLLALYINELVGTIGGQERRLNEQQTELQRQGEILTLLQSEQLEVAVMNGLERSPTAYGKILWDPRKNNLLLQASNLPIAPVEKDYQLWETKGGRSMSLGVFAVTNEQEKLGFFKVLDGGVGQKQEAQAFFVTLEAKGGAQQPTGPVYLRTR